MSGQGGLQACPARSTRGHSATGLREVVRWLALLLMLASTGLLAGCEPSSIRWTEDVRLNDGRVVTVERFVEFKGPTEPFQPRSQSRLELSFKHPNTGERVEWIGERIYTSIALFIRGDEVLLLNSVGFGGWDQLDCPNPPFILWSWKKGEWSRLPLEDLPIRYVVPNLTQNVVDLRQPGRVHWWHGLHISVEETTYPEKFRREEPLHYSFEKLERQTFGAENCRTRQGSRPTENIVYPLRRQ
jgi:hypothetical protein